MANKARISIEKNVPLAEEAWKDYLPFRKKIGHLLRMQIEMKEKRIYIGVLVKQQLKHMERKNEHLLIKKLIK
jgi:hypothetical protein